MNLVIGNSTAIVIHSFARYVLIKLYNSHLMYAHARTVSGSHLQLAHQNLHVCAEGTVAGKVTIVTD